MAVCLIIDVPGATREQYDAVMEGIGEPRLGEGQSYHVAGPSEGGWRVIDVWESREHFDRFFAERLGEQLQRSGISQPNITEFEVHNEERG